MELREACIFTQIVKALEAARDRNEVLKMLPAKYRIKGAALAKSTAEIVFRLQYQMKLEALKPRVCIALVSCDEDDIAERLTPEPDMSFVTQWHELEFADREVTESVLDDLTTAKLQHLGMVLCIMGVIGRHEINQGAYEIVDTVERHKPGTWSTHIYNALHASDVEYSAETLVIREDTTRFSDPIPPTAGSCDINRRMVKDVFFATLNKISDETLAEILNSCVSMGAITATQHRHITSVKYPRDAFVDALVACAREGDTFRDTYGPKLFALHLSLARARKEYLGDALCDAFYKIPQRS